MFFIIEFIVSSYLRICLNSHKHIYIFFVFFSEGQTNCGERWGTQNQFGSLMFHVLTQVSITNFHEIIINNVSMSGTPLLLWVSYGIETADVYFANWPCDNKLAGHLACIPTGFPETLILLITYALPLLPIILINSN